MRKKTGGQNRSNKKMRIVRSERGRGENEEE
jgi:hypothetical protein